MNPRLSEIVYEIEQVRKSLYENLSELPQEQLNESPESGGWSIGEVLYHLHLVETGVTN